MNCVVVIFYGLVSVLAPRCTLAMLVRLTRLLPAEPLPPLLDLRRNGGSRRDDCGMVRRDVTRLQDSAAGERSEVNPLSNQPDL